MAATTAEYIDRLIKNELENTSVGTNHNIYDKRMTARYPSVAFTYIPCSVYFYYFVFDSDNRPRVDHFFYDNGPLDNPGQGRPIPPAKLEAVVAELARNARFGTGNPAPNGQNFDNIVWTRKSYIVILLDEGDWSFQTRMGSGTAAVFNVSKGSTANHSFFDAMDLMVTVPVVGGGQNARSAIAFINHMKRNADGDDLLPQERQDFFFDAYVTANYSGPATAPLRVILDPGGTNMGPPLQP